MAQRRKTSIFQNGFIPNKIADQFSFSARQMSNSQVQTSVGIPKSLRLYNLLLNILSLPVVGFTLWHSFRMGGVRYFRERLGLGYKNIFIDRPIWIHAASVGEVNAVMPLVRLLTEHFPQSSILFTTMTPTGANIVSKQSISNLTHVYLPVDWRASVSRFLITYQPKCALIMETEIWPNLYDLVHSNKIPLILINGRLSSRTLNTMSWIRKIYAGTLENVTVILARSERDRDGFIALGAVPEKIKTVGNIKFAAIPLQSLEESSVGFDRPYVLAASTHDDEEKRLIEMWMAMETGGRLLVIAPRHPNRMKDIKKQIGGQVNIALRSQNQPVTGQTQVYFLDTLGELTRFMLKAEVVFMGGSLVTVGGHNILEPACFGKAIIFGPHMENFTDEAEIFLKADAAIQVQDETDLAVRLMQLLDTPQQREAMGKRAKDIIMQSQGVAQRYVEEIIYLCGLTQSINLKSSVD